MGDVRSCIAESKSTSKTEGSEAVPCISDGVSSGPRNPYKGNTTGTQPLDERILSSVPIITNQLLELYRCSGAKGKKDWILNSALPWLDTHTRGSPSLEGSRGSGDEEITSLLWHQKKRKKPQRASEQRT